MTRRGLLGYIMSPYDPFGIAAPAMLSTKLFQRELIPPEDNDPHGYHALGWDGALPNYLTNQWQEMIRTCEQVQQLTVPRSFYSPGKGRPVQQQLFAFSDASDMAMCYVSYLRTETEDGSVFCSFVAGSTKVLPKRTSVKGQISIPRAELEAARDLAEKVLDTEKEIDIPDLLPTVFFTDSRVVLTWIQDPSQQLKRYCASRVNTIRTISDPNAWHYIATKLNPADIGTRPITVKELQKSVWLSGPEFLRQNKLVLPTDEGQTEGQHILLTRSVAPEKSYFKNKSRLATEDITNGVA